MLFSPPTPNQPSQPIQQNQQSLETEEDASGRFSIADSEDFRRRLVKETAAAAFAMGAVSKNNLAELFLSETNGGDPETSGGDEEDESMSRLSSQVSSRSASSTRVPLLFGRSFKGDAVIDHIISTTAKSTPSTSSKEEYTQSIDVGPSTMPDLEDDDAVSVFDSERRPRPSAFDGRSLQGKTKPTLPEPPAKVFVPRDMTPIVVENRKPSFGSVSQSPTPAAPAPVEHELSNRNSFRLDLKKYDELSFISRRITPAVSSADAAREAEEAAERKKRYILMELSIGNTPKGAGKPSIMASSATGAVTTSTAYFTYEALKGDNCPEGVNPFLKEVALFDEEFESLFKMSKSEFATQPKWKKDKVKKELALF